MTGRVGLAGLMLALLAGVAPATAAPLERCRDDMSARCGTMEVPLHRAEPQGPR